jgi:RHS repeat-associated protein
MAMRGLDFMHQDLPANKKNDYLYNGKELQTDHGLDWYDYGARFYDAALGRFMSPDPHAEKYHHFNPYNYVLNNPVNMIDPDGKDCIFTIEYGQDGKISGVKISSTIYITGNRAKGREDEFNKQAKSVYVSKETDDGVKISFDINYVYKESVKEDDLQAGENILEFVDHPGKVTPTGQTAGDAQEYKYPNGIKLVGKKGTIFSNESHKTVMHETGHLLGLIDRADRKGNTHVGFQNNLMSYDGGTKLHGIQYRMFYEYAKVYKVINYPEPYVNKLYIDWNHFNKRAVNQLDYPQYFKENEK